MHFVGIFACVCVWFSLSTPLLEKGGRIFFVGISRISCGVLTVTACLLVTFSPKKLHENANHFTLASIF